MVKIILMHFKICTLKKSIYPTNIKTRKFVSMDVCYSFT